MSTLLRMEHIHKKFPGVYALNDVSLELHAGEVHALLGENGAGKSTLIKVLGGIYHPEEGKIFIDDQEVTINGVLAAEAAGVAIIHQELVLAPYMTVAENIFLGREPSKGFYLDKKTMYEETDKLLGEYGLKFSSDTLVVDLTIAQQQMVEIIKAISHNSKILVMDEPTSSISDKEVNFLFSIMRNLTAQGVGIIYISHKMSEIFDICDRVTVLRDGQYVCTDIVKETTRDHLIAQMVGRELSNYYTRDYLPQGEVVLSMKGINDGGMVKDGSLELHKGEILGLSGLVGAGRSEMMHCLFGLTKKYSGEITMNGKSIHYTKPQEAFNAGIALVPEDRKLDGLYLVQSVKFNTTIEVLKEFLHGVVYDSGREEEITEEYIQKMNTKTPSQDQVIRNLSGGNQQKVLIGRWLATKPEILILDEPTRGVDVGAKAEIYAIMNELVKQGMAIIMISSELPEILNMSDRIYVMAEGVTTGCLDHTEATQQKIMQLAAI